MTRMIDHLQRERAIIQERGYAEAVVRFTVRMDRQSEAFEPAILLQTILDAAREMGVDGEVLQGIYDEEAR